VRDLLLVVIACGFGTYIWRALGVALSGRLQADSELFHWISCVAYAMIAALVSRIVFLPSGLLAQSALTERLAACALALVVYFATRRNLFLGVGAGVATLIGFGYLRGV
jgi:branched-subunit amino acid transport protein